jgi:hypothetical protein
MRSNWNAREKMHSNTFLEILRKQDSAYFNILLRSVESATPYAYHTLRSKYQTICQQINRTK